MFPAYGYNKHSYPQVRPQMSTDRRHHPFPEVMPPQMRMEAANSPFIHESWPHHYGYPVPTQCHSCCNHNPYPTYYPYRPPPYPHFPSTYGSYPVYPDSFHYAPPPHYTMELPKYEYDKNMPKDFHCCGCSHHKPDMIRDKGVKIVEQESEAEDKEDSLVPAGFNNLQEHPQPIVWVPSDYLQNQERPSDTKPRQSLQSGWPPLDYESIKRLLESGDGRSSHDKKIKSRVNPGEREVVDHHKEPRWVPLDMDNLKRLLQNGSLRKDDDDQPRNEVHQMPFPMIWLPYNEDKGQMSDKREASSASELSWQQPFRSEQAFSDDNKKCNAAVGVEGKEGGKLSIEKSEKPPRIIPVKQMDGSAEVKTSNGMKTKNMEDDKKSSEKGNKNKPSSPTKASRLPPICLRVDPLPKKKNGQGKSRSPSPPGHKHVEAVKPSSSMSENKAENEVEKNVLEMVNDANAVVDKLPKLVGGESEGNDVGEKLKAEEKKPEETSKPEKILSGTEAATLIQSAYRGYEVRRWEPLKKMRQIANIRDEAAALRRSIESGAAAMDLKQKIALGETIMNLLLKLDTVQGLHSSVRDIRKSVAKELLSLQEMLDTIGIKQPDHSPAETRAVAVETTPQIPEESSAIPDMNEAEAKAGELVLQIEDESSPNFALSKTEDQGTVEIEEEGTSCLHELSAQEPCTMPELSDEMTHEQEMLEKEREKVTSENDPTSFGEEVGGLLLDSHTDQNEFDVVEEAAIKNLVEGHIGSSNQTDMTHGLQVEMPVAVMEEDGPKTTISFTPKESQQVNVESETPVSEPDMLQGSDEVSIGEVTIEQDVESAALEEVHVPDNDGEAVDDYLTKTMKIETPFEVSDQAEVMMENPSLLVKPEVVHEEDAKPAEEDVKLVVSSTENYVKEDFRERRVMEENEKMRSLLEKMISSGKEQQEVICRLNEKLKELEDKLANQKQKRGSRARKARVLMARSSKEAPRF